MLRKSYSLYFLDVLRTVADRLAIGEVIRSTTRFDHPLPLSLSAPALGFQIQERYQLDIRSDNYSF